jgi:peptidoglycan hydrolase-like protein with peptidoglycan-binding domain
MKQLIGHTSPDTAYLVSDYPYGFRLRTSIRYWIETKKGFGQRFVSQTMNPKNGKWNKPKAGTYYLAMVMVLEDNGYVGHAALHAADTYFDAKTENFLESYQLETGIRADVLTMVALQKRVSAAYEAKMGLE